MKSLFHFLIFLAISTTSYGQAEKEVKTVITKMFEGMIKGDSALVHTTMDNQCSLKSIIRKKDGSTMVAEEAFVDFLNFVGSPQKSKIEERLLAYDIKVDGDMAMAWTPYQFFIDEKLSHCGVNVFILARRNNIWKIISICDTRRKEYK